MDSGAKKELRSLLPRARKDGRKPFAGYIKEGDGSIHVLRLDDSSEFVYRRLKRFEPELLASFQAKWPQYRIVKVTVVPRINNEDAREAVALGGTFQVYRGQKIKDLMMRTMKPVTRACAVTLLGDEKGVSSVCLTKG